MDLQSPVMGHLLSLPQGNAVIPSVTVRKMGSLIVPVTVSFPSLTAILVGFLPETDFILATTYICLSPLTPKVTSPFFLCWILPQNMILMDFRKPGSEWNLSFLIFTSASGSWILPMMQCRIISTVVRTTFSSLLTWMWSGAWHVSQRFIADLSLMSAISGLLLRKCLFFQNQDIPVF